jgi:murein DD-endopeptidase MepM/ murein hydrolase activator NlpD
MVPTPGADAPPNGERSAGDPDDESGRSRRLPDPTNLSLLGVLSIPGFLVDDLALLRGFVLFFLFGFWPLVGLVVSSRDDSSGWVQTGDRWSTARFLCSTLVLQVNPWVQLQAFRQLAGHAAIYLRYRFDLPDPDSFEQATTYRLPVEGEWTVATGSHEKASSHSWGILTQRYAYDLVVTDADGRTHAGDGTDRASYYCWEEPVLAPADGVVIAASDGHRDAPRTRGWLDLTQRDIRGNFVVVEHAGGEYSVLAHLREGSVAVSERERVRAGQQVGLCGHSGNSTEPHLHFHVQDSPSFYRAAGLPVVFDDLAVAVGPDDPLRRRATAALTAGQRVRADPRRTAEPPAPRG